MSSAFSLTLACQGTLEAVEKSPRQMNLSTTAYDPEMLFIGEDFVTQNRFCSMRSGRRKEDEFHLACSVQMIVK